MKRKHYKFCKRCHRYVFHRAKHYNSKHKEG